MRESRFVRQNTDRWTALEAALEAREPVAPERLTALYAGVADDLAFAQTHFPDSETARYLNALAGRLHRRIYVRRTAARHRFVTFWAHDVPEALFAARGALALSAAVFFAAMALGVISAAGDGAIVRLIFGDAYVHATLDNIARGDPMAIYKQNAADMFVGITINNVMVSFRAFAFGLLAGVGTLYVLLLNGIMLGAFGQFLAAEGVLAAGMRTVWIHGTLEIASILVAGGAGLELARGMLLPGSLPRGTAFLEASRRGVTIVLGLVPMFVVAGFIEAFVTRHTEMPLVLALGIILGSLVFSLWYFVLYPRKHSLRHD